MIAIIDYGMGNLRSVQKAVEKAGTTALITQDPRQLSNAEKIVLPGVGAMAPAMEKLQQLGFVDAINRAIKSGKPFLGICLGVQLLFEKSTEGGDVRGLGIFAGTVERFSPQLKVPHMGWNQLRVQQNDCPLWRNLDRDPCVYFCHSYYVKPVSDKLISTTTEYGIPFASAVAQDNVFGVQFHPEKSQTTGLKILENFVNI